VTTTRSALRDDLIRLGVRQGDLLLVHAGVRAIGRIGGGVNVLVEALFDTIGGAGVAEVKPANRI
jgi:aminoglycoside N3'-acetyltransferase